MKKKKEKNYLDYLKSFWKYLWYGDSFGSYVLSFLVAFLIIKFMFFPALGFVLNNDYPIVAIVSGSMEHKITDHRVCDKYIPEIQNKRLSFDEWWSFCSDYYIENFNITKEQFQDFKYSRGLNTGDVMILFGRAPERINVGDVLVFEPENRVWFESHGPVIHRVVDRWQDDGIWYFQTKGDHNSQSFDNFEKRIPEDKVIGVAVVRIPYIGYAKIFLNNIIVFFLGVFR